MRTPRPTEMIDSTLAAPERAAQPHCSQADKADGNRLFQLQALPAKWRQALLAIGTSKQPIDPSTGRALPNWPTSPVPSLHALMAAPAVGLRTGPISQTICLDFDGAEAWRTFRELFGKDAADLLPPSISWTSGKPARCQMAFHLPPRLADKLNGKRRKVGTLELRWWGAQSVLMGHHPETGRYHWLEGRAPWEVALADFPPALLDLVPSISSKPARQEHAPHVAGLVLPLEQFITLRSRILIEQGSPEGQCNSDALALSLDLVGAELWVKAQGGTVERSAQELFDDYCRQCPDRINGKPFDWRAMQARFDGAVKRCPTPPTPEHKLIERLAYHRRMTARRGLEVAA
jgi:hypothetical protein